MHDTQIQHDTKKVIQTNMYITNKSQIKNLVSNAILPVVFKRTMKEDSIDNKLGAAKNFNGYILSRRIVNGKFTSTLNFSFSVLLIQKNDCL